MSLISGLAYFITDAYFRSTGCFIPLTLVIVPLLLKPLISQRTTEALTVRRQQGMPLGRPKGVGKSKLDAYQVEIVALLKNGATKTWIAQKYGTTRRNLSHWMKQHGIV